VEAGKEVGCVPTIVAASGVENVNGEVDELVKTGVLRRILALVEVAFSNLMIEALNPNSTWNRVAEEDTGA
jgi:hypothetical protein